MSPAPDPALLPAHVQEGPWLFRSCVPVTFQAARNAESSPHFGALYGQDIEPAGRYMITRLATEYPLSPPWQALSVSFRCPLVIKLVSSSDEPTYGPQGWKARLLRHYHRAGRELSLALLREGWDGIVTVGVGPDGAPVDTREIIDLRPVQEGPAPKPRRARP
jgi:hypothetical protein